MIGIRHLGFVVLVLFGHVRELGGGVVFFVVAEPSPPLMTNSDHANFALGGIPAIRLVAGFDDPAAHLRVVLTPADTRDKVAQSELRQATLLTAALVAAACNADPAEAARWRAK